MISSHYAPHHSHPLRALQRDERIPFRCVIISLLSAAIFVWTDGPAHFEYKAGNFKSAALKSRRSIWFHKRRWKEMKCLWFLSFIPAANPLTPQNYYFFFCYMLRKKNGTIKKNVKISTAFAATVHIVIFLWCICVFKGRGIVSDIWSWSYVYFACDYLGVSWDPKQFLLYLCVRLLSESVSALLAH